MMEENQDALFRLALRRHGLSCSESESDSDDGFAEFDDTHEQNKPPPLDPEFIRKNRIVIYPKEIENVWAKRMEEFSKKTENIKVDSGPISNRATPFVQDVGYSSGISEKKVTNQKLEITENGSPNTRALKAEIKYVDPKSHLLRDSLMETSIKGQCSLEVINNLVANKSSVAEVSKLSQKKKKKRKKNKKKSASEKNIEEISAEGGSHNFVERVGNSVTTKVDAGVTHLENVYLKYARPEMKPSENYYNQWNEISSKIYNDSEKIESNNENRKNYDFVSLDTDNAIDKNNKFTKINSIKEENVRETKITTKSNLYGNMEEQTNSRKELSSTGQINDVKKKKKVKYVPCNLLDEKFFSTTQTIKDFHNKKKIPKNKTMTGAIKKKNLHQNNISKLDNNVNSYQQLALSPLVNSETNGQFNKHFPKLNTHLVNEINDIIEKTETKQKNSFEEKNIKLASYESINLQDQTNNCNKELSSAKTAIKKKNLRQNNISKLDNNVNSYQQLALSPLVNSETNGQFNKHFPKLNTHLVNEINEKTETKQKNSFEEKNIKLASYESINLQDQTNNCNNELSSAKTETSYKKRKKTKFVRSNLLDEKISTIPPVSHTQQNSDNRGCEKTESGTEMKTKIQLVPCITSIAEFSHTQKRMPNNKPPTEKKISNRGSSPDLSYSGDIDKILEIPHFGQKNIHPTGACVTFRTFDEEIKKNESILMNELNYQQNIIITNNREGTSGSDNVLSLVSGVRKKNEMKGTVSRLNTNHTETDKNVYCLLKFYFPSNLDLGSHLRILNQNNSCIGFNTFNGNVKEYEDKAYRKKEPYYEKHIRALSTFDNGKYANSTTNCLLSILTELEKFFSEFERQNKEITLHKFEYTPKTLWSVLNYLKNIQFGLEINLYSGNSLKSHNFNELDSYVGIMDFISDTGGLESSYKVEKRVSVLVQPCYDYSLKKNAETNDCVKKDFMYNESTKETRNQRDILTENIKEEMLHFTLECEGTNGGRSDNTILIKADKTVTNPSDNYEISYINEKNSDNKLGKTLSNPMKNEINENTTRTVTETSKVPYPFTKIVHLIFVCVFLHLVISFMNWVIDNCLPLTLFFMCIIILKL